MQGRYGVDSLSKFTMGFALVSVILSVFTGRNRNLAALLDFLGLAAIVYTYFRIFSRNIRSAMRKIRNFSE